MDTRLTHNLNATAVTKIGLCFTNYLNLPVSVANNDKVPASATPPMTSFMSALSPSPSPLHNSARGLQHRPRCHLFVLVGANPLEPQRPLDGLLARWPAHPMA
jgi:hypothetical protein